MISMWCLTSVKGTFEDAGQLGVVGLLEEREMSADDRPGDLVPDLEVVHLGEEGIPEVEAGDADRVEHPDPPPDGLDLLDSARASLGDLLDRTRSR